jgi:NTP pyrophosphatase (non-canonical NTP hydrolase)
MNLLKTNVDLFRGFKPEGIASEMADCIIRILDYCAYEGIDIEQAIQLKHEYNKTRPYRHGGKRI